MNAYARQIVGHFRERRDQVFSHVVVDDETHTVRWRDLERGCRQVAACLAEACGRPTPDEGRVVLIFLPHGTALFPAFLGAMLGGFVPSFMPCPSARQDPDLYWQSHQALLRRIRPAAVISNAGMFEQMAACGLDTGSAVQIDEDELFAIAPVSPPDESSPAPEFVARDGRAIALLQHSSGTTGLKKGVALSFDAIAAHARSYGRTLGVGESDTVVSWLPLYHDMGLIACFVTPAWTGTGTVQMSAFEWVNRPQQLFKLIERHRGTLCWLPNFAFEHLIHTVGRHAGRFDLSSVRAFISCSEPCKAATFARFRETFEAAGLGETALGSCYAMAETVFGVTQSPLGAELSHRSFERHRLDRGDRVVEIDEGEDSVELVDCGVPLGGIDLRIVDAERRPLEDGSVGEIAIAGDFLFDGYHEDPERTRRSVEGGRYHSNDLGFLHGGRLYVLGRVDDLIIVNGRNLFAHQIEALAGRIPGLKAGRVVALPIPDERTGSNVLVIVAERDADAMTDERSVVRAALTLVESEIDVLPHAVELLERGSLLKTSSGKLSRRENLRRYLDGGFGTPLGRAA